MPTQQSGRCAASSPTSTVPANTAAIPPTTRAETLRRNRRDIRNSSGRGRASLTAEVARGQQVLPRPTAQWRQGFIRSADISWVTALPVPEAVEGSARRVRLTVGVAAFGIVLILL